ncbi:MAG: cytochrome b/b6 domain-containing protein [Alphaproteobacteria bacterium]|nr:cytochrome b/b6 domain-containing protein [Alphaproteobacteria bacterium]
MSRIPPPARPAAAPPTHPAATRWLHWGSAALLVAAFVLGLVMEEWPRGAPRDTAMMVHYSLGALVLGLVCIRLLRRILLPPAVVGPARGAPAGPVAADLVAAAAHWTLYAMMLVLPLTGALDRWARGRRLAVFGDLVIPPPFAIPGGKLWGEVHETIAYALVALVAAHVAAALWHHFVLRDGVLLRMLPPGSVPASRGGSAVAEPRA